MKNLIVFTFTMLMLSNITGCSVVRFAETRIGSGVKNANKTKMDLDFQLGFNATDNSLRVTLAYQPYAIYKPKITLTDLGVGLASLGLLGKVLYDNWDHDDTFTFVDDTFDWYGSEPWEKAVMIGVPVDILLYWVYAYPFDRKAIGLQRQPLTDHPYRIELPDHSNIGRDYRTTTGTEQLYIRDFLSQLGSPPFLKDVESLKFKASTKIGEKRYDRDHTVPLLLSNKDDPDPPPPPPPKVEVDVQWIRDRIRAGEKATLKITVKNSDKTVLTAFTTTTESPNHPRFDNWELKFGSIAPGASKTRALGFSTDSEMSPQKIPIKLHFKAADGFTYPEEVEKILSIVE